MARDSTAFKCAMLEAVASKEGTEASHKLGGVSWREAYLEIWWSCRLVHSWNWCFHWSTETLLVTRHSTLFLMRDAAVMPTSDLPAPQGSTMMPAHRKTSMDKLLVTRPSMFHLMPATRSLQ